MASSKTLELRKLPEGYQRERWAKETVDGEEVDMIRPHGRWSRRGKSARGKMVQSRHEGADPYEWNATQVPTPARIGRRRRRNAIARQSRKANR